MHGDTGGFRGRKTTLYQGGLRVPAIVRLPGTVPAGATTAAPATALDLFPNHRPPLRGPVPNDRPIDGIDLADVLRGGAGRADRRFYWALPNPT